MKRGCFMLSQIAYVRQQIQRALRAGTPSQRVDHLQRALDGLERVEALRAELTGHLASWATAVNAEADKRLAAMPDPFLPQGKES